jgi:hypothetical protein
MSRASVAQQLILFCKLERSGQHVPTTLEFYRLLALINRAQFVVSPAQQGELAALARDCPAVCELAHRILALRL